MITKEELLKEVKEITSGESFSIELENGDDWEVGASDMWLGGDDFPNSVGSDLLGNTAYSDRKKFVNELFSFIEKDLSSSIICIN